MLASDILLRKVPEHLLLGVQRGELDVFGSIIRSNSTGRIVAHLQETGLMSQLLAQAPIDPITGALSVVGQGVQIAQNEQIKTGLRAIQNFQEFGLALNALSIGISVAGFAMLNQKISALEAEISIIRGSLTSIETKLDALWIETWRKDCQRLKTLAEQLDESWFLSDGRGELADVAKEAHFLANEFHRQAQRALESETVYLAATPAVDAFALASAVRVTARLAMDENKAALETSIGCSEKMSTLLDVMKPGQATVAQMRLASNTFGTPAWEESLEMERKRYFEPLLRLRTTESACAGRGITLARLVEQGVSGRDWLETVASEKDAPLLVWEDQG